MSSPFSGSAGRRAAVAEMAYLGEAQKGIDQRIKSGRNAGLKSLNSGYKSALGVNQQEQALYNPYRDTGLKALGQYSDAAGLNGQEGHDRAVAAFRAGPGYQYQVDQATDAVARKASALGMLGSGNTMAAISDRAGHMADQEYDRYLGRLDGLNRLGYDATGRQAGVLSDRADLFTGRGRDRASVYGDATRLGVSTAQHTADGTVSALHGGMMAGQNAAANRFGAIMGGLQLGSRLLGGAAGGGLSKLGSLFG